MNDTLNYRSVNIRFIGHYQYSDLDDLWDFIRGGDLYVVPTHSRVYYIAVPTCWPDEEDDRTHETEVVAGRYLLKLLKNIRNYDDNRGEGDWKKVREAIIRFARENKKVAS